MKLVTFLCDALNFFFHMGSPKFLASTQIYSVLHEFSTGYLDEYASKIRALVSFETDPTNSDSELTPTTYSPSLIPMTNDLPLHYAQVAATNLGHTDPPAGVPSHCLVPVIVEKVVV